MNTIIHTGSAVLDSLLSGGFERDIVTTIFGPSGSGKTNFCILTALEVAGNGKKVLFVDTEGGISVERMKQIKDNYEQLLQNMVFYTPTSFSEQKEAFDKLRKVIDEKVGLIIVDSIAMLYRLEMGKNEDVYNINRELGQQISYLTEIARKKNIPVLLTNQVYANFDNKSRVNMVGGDILKYGSKCLIELSVDEVTKERKAILKKHRFLPEDREIKFMIENKGIFEKKTQEKESKSSNQNIEVDDILFEPGDSEDKI